MGVFGTKGTIDLFNKKKLIIIMPAMFIDLLILIVTMEDHWVGPHGIFVPALYDKIIDADGTKIRNRMDLGGPDIGVRYPPTKEQYLKTFCELRPDGNYWYKGYWVGPYGIRVPSHLTHIKAADGANILRNNGSVTERGLGGRNPLTKEEYLAKYTELRDDGHRWYKENN
jgi:hypothetical protein